jgi:hypothetical protein
MAQKAPKTALGRRSTSQAAGTRSSNRGTVVTTHGHGSTVTVNPGKDTRSKAVKAAAAEIVGGGPEDPAADAAAAKAVSGSTGTRRGSSAGSSSRSSRSSSSRSGTTGTSGSSGGSWRETAKAGTAAGKAARWASKPKRQVLLAEFLICMVIVGLGVLGVEPDKASSHLVRRVSALCALFFILAVAASWGDGPRRAANGLGALVTLTFLMTERKGFTALANFFTSAQGNGDKSAVGTQPNEDTETQYSTTGGTG